MEHNTLHRCQEQWRCPHSGLSELETKAGAVWGRFCCPLSPWGAHSIFSLSPSLIFPCSASGFLSCIFKDKSDWFRDHSRRLTLQNDALAIWSRSEVLGVRGSV